MARIEERERMSRLVKRWRRSGQTGAAFCRAHGVKPQKLSYWKRVLGVPVPRGKRRTSRPRRNALVPIRLMDRIGAGTLEIHLASGDRMVVHEGSSGELVREVLGLLRERC
jgi:hypothetical protein